MRLRTRRDDTAGPCVQCGRLLVGWRARGHCSSISPWRVVTRSAPPPPQQHEEDGRKSGRAEQIPCSPGDRDFDFSVAKFHVDDSPLARPPPTPLYHLAGWRWRRHGRGRPGSGMSRRNPKSSLGFDSIGIGSIRSTISSCWVPASTSRSDGSARGGRVPVPLALARSCGALHVGVVFASSFFFFLVLV